MVRCLDVWVGFICAHATVFAFIPMYLVILWASTATSQISADDVIYCVLPLYHSSGCNFVLRFIHFCIRLELTMGFALVLISAGSALTAGATLVIGRKFSASKFWDDCVKYRVTVFHVRSICTVQRLCAKLRKKSTSVNFVDTC